VRFVPREKPPEKIISRDDRTNGVDATSARFTPLLTGQLQNGTSSKTEPAPERLQLQNGTSSLIQRRRRPRARGGLRGAAVLRAMATAMDFRPHLTSSSASSNTDTGTL